MLDACLKSCVDAGYDSCRTATFDPNAAVAMCHLYDTSISEMGAHATAQVPIQGGLGVVSASYCKPPVAVDTYPTNPSTLYGAVLRVIAADCATTLAAVLNTCLVARDAVQTWPRLHACN